MASPQRCYFHERALRFVALSALLAPGGCSATSPQPASTKPGRVDAIAEDAGSNVHETTARGGAAGGSAAGASGRRSASGASGVSGAVAAPSGGTSALGGVGGTHGAGTASAAVKPRPMVTASAGTSLIKIEPAVRHQTFEGWGTSLCWWADHVGGWKEDARNWVADTLVDPVNGLGYNIFRYNIGGGENPAHSHMGPYKALPGFQPSKGNWTWDADANQRAILQRVVLRGSQIILEAFSNSPPYWMTKSSCASGSSDGSNNLKDDAYDDFADYLTEVVKHYRDELGIHFRTLEPLNEPNANWWKANGQQEGCHFAPKQQQQIIDAVSAQLVAKGLSETTVSASDENSLDDAYNNLRAFDDASLAAVSQLNVHSYAGSRRKELRELATSKHKRLWQSESGPLGQTLADDTEAALFMAGRIISDLRELQPEAWVDWQTGDPSPNWASIVLDDENQSFATLKRYHMHANFSRFIRPGATFIEVDNEDMVAALSADGESLALVVRNGDKTASKSFTFDLARLASVGAEVQVLRTSRTENLVPLAKLPIQDWSFVAKIEPFSITTFLVPLALPSETAGDG